MIALVVTEGLAVLLLGVLVAGLLRSHAEILKALHDLGAGLDLDGGGSRPVPDTVDGIAPPPTTSAVDVPQAVIGVTLDQEAVAVPLLGGRDVLLAFLSSGCLTCAGFWEAFAGEVTGVPGGARLVVVTRDSDEESASVLRQRQPSSVPLVLSTAAWDAFGIPGSPYFVYVDGTHGRVVGQGSAASWPQVVNLLSQAKADDAARAHRRRGRDDDAVLSAAGLGPGHASLHREGDR